MYNDSDLRTVWQAWQNRMKKYQLAEMLGVSEHRIEMMIDAAQRRWGRTEKIRQSIKAFHEQPRQPIQRPPARYDNKSSEERINELLGSDL